MSILPATKFQSLICDLYKMMTLDWRISHNVIYISAGTYVNCLKMNDLNAQFKRVLMLLSIGLVFQILEFTDYDVFSRVHQFNL